LLFNKAVRWASEYFSLAFGCTALSNDMCASHVTCCKKLGLRHKYCQLVTINILSYTAVITWAAITQSV
jgi:hypothetical protein